MTERTSIPGFHVGRRYRGLGQAPMFFISYETADAAVMKSEPYLEALNSPTPWTKEALTHFNNNTRNIYGLVASAGAQAPTEAPYAYVVRFNVKTGEEADTLQWYTQMLMPALVGVSGVFRVRLYAVDEEISNIMTAERAVYGGGPGQQKYMAYHEMASPDLPRSDAWNKMKGSGGNPAMFNNIIDSFEEVSWLEFVMYGPEET